MPADFEKDQIEIRYYSENYGPFKFDFEKALPSGTTISTAAVKSYLGKVDPGDNLSAETDTTSELIDDVLTVVSGDYGVNVYFNYPTTATYKAEKHTLIFELTLDNTAKHAYYYHYADVK